MSQGMNDLLANITNPIPTEELAIAGLEASICGEIIAQRIKRGMTQAQFAEYLGVSQGMISKWEAGNYNFTLRSLARIASKLELSLQSPIAVNTPRYTSAPKVIGFPSKWNTAQTSLPAYHSVELKEM